MALANGKANFLVAGKEHSLDTNFSSLNGTEGFAGAGRDTFFSENRAIRNTGHGLTSRTPAGRRAVTARA